MEAIIERSVIFMHSDERNHNMLSVFNFIIQAITTSKNVEQLRKNMNNLIPNSRYFEYGFSGSHMWVKQKDVKSDSSVVNEDERILIVKF